MSNQSTDEMREAFEKFWTDTMNVEVMDLYRLEYPMDGGWAYEDHDTNRSWMTWQAATASAEAKYIPVIGKLVGKLYMAKNLISHLSPLRPHSELPECQEIEEAIEEAWRLVDETAEL